MKVLFAVSNDNISTSVVAKYQQKYKEIITSKNVYYFNAIIKELQNDKDYDAVVIGEDLEPISNNNYDAIDKFILEKLDRISDEASKPTGEDIPIIFICSDRRNKMDQLLRKLFSMSIYNALVGNDRSLDMVCSLINKPRNKKDAKRYYQIDGDSVEYEPEKEELVSEDQIKNILSYYKKIGNNTKKCVSAFDSIANQYDNTQLRIIVKFLPMEVKAILESNSITYQKLMENGTVASSGINVYPNDYGASNPNIIATNLDNNYIKEPVIIPSSMGSKNNELNSNKVPTNNTIKQNNFNYQPRVQQNSNGIQPGMPQRNPFQQNSFNQPNGLNSPYFVNARPTNNTQQRPQQNRNMYQAPNRPGSYSSQNPISPYQPFNPQQMPNGVRPYNPIHPVNSNGMNSKIPNMNNNREKINSGFNPINTKIENKPEENKNIDSDLDKVLNPNNLLKPVEEENKNNIIEEKKQDTVDVLKNDLELNNNPVQDNKEEIVAVQPKPIGSVKRGRGRPRKTPIETEVEVNKVKRGRGRPRKNEIEESTIPNTEDKSLVLQNDNKPTISTETPKSAVINEFTPNFTNKVNENKIEKKVEEPTFEMPGFEEPKKENTDFGFEMPGSETKENKKEDITKTTSSGDIDLFNLGIDDNNDYSDFKSTPYTPLNSSNELNSTNITSSTDLADFNKSISESQSNFTIAGNGKIVAFVGSTKNGTSFIINNIAQLLSNDGINTCIIDLTRNKNSYYLYTDNDNKKSTLASNSLENLSNGKLEGLKVNNNLTLFTALPEATNNKQLNIANILNLSSSNYDVVLLDCDLKTEGLYFKKASEIYLVQSMDAFTIQPLTKFLSDLKINNDLNENKLRVIINKYVKLKKVDYKMIVGGMSKYNEPSMTLQRDLFDAKKIQVSLVPFDMQTYLKYLETIAFCQISINGYSNEVIQSLKTLENQVYPLIGQGSRNNKKGYGYYNNQDFQNQNDYNNAYYNQQGTTNTFSNNVSDTLNKMRKNNF